MCKTFLLHRDFNHRGSLAELSVVHAQAIPHPVHGKGTPPKHTLICYKLLSISTCFSLSTSGSWRHEQTQKSNPFHNCDVPSLLHLAKSTCHFLYKKEVHRYLPKIKSKLTGRKIRSKKSLAEALTCVRSRRKKKKPFLIRKSGTQWNETTQINW